MISNYGEPVPFTADLLAEVHHVQDEIARLLTGQAQRLFDDPVFQYCNSSIWNRRIWEYLIDTTPVKICYTI